jgi:hypothetical protein
LNTLVVGLLVDKVVRQQHLNFLVDIACELGFTAMPGVEDENGVIRLDVKVGVGCQIADMVDNFLPHGVLIKKDLDTFSRDTQGVLQEGLHFIDVGNTSLQVIDAGVRIFVDSDK